jgi:2-polyprenyl-3-methyl-5-hydroxy-6-metoxy-1,4-benzoquinol methylase
MKKPPHKPHAKRPHVPREHQPSRPSHAPAKETHWGDVADWYDKLVGDDGSEYHQHVVIPGVFRMLDVPNKKLHVLDLACGQGVLSRKLAEAGSTVLGIDAAAPLIETARRRNETEKLPITYTVADATKLVDDRNNLLPPLKPDSQDAITLILAIQNMTPLSPVWQACKAILKPGGVLIAVMMHPCFRIPRQSDWLWEDRGSGGVGEQVRTIKQYLTSSKVDIQTHPGLAAHGKSETTTPHFHRPLQAYINTLGNAGLLIDHVEEWISHKTSQPGPKKAALDRARKEIPMFLALRARKTT